MKRKVNTVSAPPELLVVILESVGNPDFGQYAPLSPKQIRTVKSFSQASDVCREYIVKWSLGGGNWSGGQIIDTNGQTVAYVSYNGAIWDRPIYEFNEKKEFCAKRMPQEVVDMKYSKLKIVTITHTIDIGGFDLKKGMKMFVVKDYWRNGETQVVGYIDGRDKKQEVPAVWTDITF